LVYANDSLDDLSQELSAGFVKVADDFFILLLTISNILRQGASIQRLVLNSDHCDGSISVSVLFGAGSCRNRKSWGSVEYLMSGEDCWVVFYEMIMGIFGLFLGICMFDADIVFYWRDMWMVCLSWGLI
jgi:hypothetical protein